MNLKLARRSFVAIALVGIAVVFAVPALAADKPASASNIAYTEATNVSSVTFFLKITHAVKGTRAVSSCRGGRAKGCPTALLSHPKTITAKKRGTLSLYPAFKGNKLKRGAVVKVKWFDPKSLYRDITITINEPTEFASQTNCEQADGTEVGCNLNG
jgi:hypothetical protein